MIAHYYPTCFLILLFLLQLEMSKRREGNTSCSYELDGSETLGSYLRIIPCSDGAPDLSKCSIQWYRVSPEGSKKELISGTYYQPFSCTLIFFYAQHFCVWLDLYLHLKMRSP